MRALLLLLLLHACANPGPDDAGSDADPDVLADTAARCGDGVVQGEEACDDGEANSDTLADACRTTCLLPACGDGVVDAEEACDDGGLLGGDGCDPRCAAERFPGEQEPNDTPPLATAAEDGGVRLGGLTEGDVDCFWADVPDNAVLVAVASGLDGTCPPALTLRLHDPDGERLVTAFAPAEGCARIDGTQDADASYLDAGRYTVCVEGLQRSAVPAYRVEISLLDDACASGVPPAPRQDPDGDGLADGCDPDDDGDGVLDGDDNCPLVPNGPTPIGLSTAADGSVRTWMVAAPITGRATTTGCLPSVDADAGEDGSATPALGTASPGGPTWRLERDDDGRYDLAARYAGSTPREAYAAMWVQLPEPTRVRFGVGADDGSRLFVNTTQVGEDAGCHGVTPDQFQWAADLPAGWQLLRFKVRDHGGAWGFVVRLRDDATGQPLAGLPVSPVAGTWVDDQTDSDGDGLGDACDPTP